MSEEAVYAACRVKGSPAVPSVERFCSRCHHPVWVDVNLASFADGLTIICIDCTVTKALEEDETPELAIHPWTLHVLRTHARRN